MSSFTTPNAVRSRPGILANRVDDLLLGPAVQWIFRSGHFLNWKINGLV